MTITQITENKKQYLDLLLLADEQESMIDRYLERGELFVLEDEGVKAVGVVTDEGDGVCELKNIEISVTDLRYEMEKYGIRDQIDKSSFASILTLFTKYQLLQVIGKLGEEDCRICLYPSMQFVLEPQEFGKFVENVNRRMQEKWSREDEWETELTSCVR